ncbi:MAG: GNAT family N-acetyltransferase [Alphaproteobacteria bacterium]|nr:GNAT family N-acetyltransferase [Alphaproteobacteria bacterium]
MTFAIRPAREDEYGTIARVWYDSWLSIGIANEKDATLAELRARIPKEVESGWELYAAELDGEIAAMLAFKRKENYLDQLFVEPSYHGQGIGKALLVFAREAMPDEMWLRTAEANIKAIAWYEREGFVREKLEQHPTNGRMMAYYRWKRLR